jgi:pyruvate dehydrogenase E1 component alpha subunit
MSTSSISGNLGHLADPGKFHDPVDLCGFKRDVLVRFLKTMIMIRKVEQQLALGRKAGQIGGPVHLGVGQEAVAVGVSDSLRASDRVFGAHRSHSHLLALNSDYYRLFAEVLGKQSGFSRGMGGSMHLWDQPSGFYGSVPIVSGTVALAVGAAMAARLQNTDDVAVVYFGDGAMEEGVVHESLNLARMQQSPILFVVENNLFASHMHVSLRQPTDLMTRFAVANDIPGKLVDGNNVVAVAEAAAELVHSSRQGNGPGFLELVTYRWYGHVDWREDIDVGVNRSPDDVENWRARDPIGRLSVAMIKADIWTDEEESTYGEQLDDEISVAWDRAMEDPYPDDSATMNRVYAI